MIFYTRLLLAEQVLSEFFEMSYGFARMGGISAANTRTSFLQFSSGLKSCFETESGLISLRC